MKTDMNYVLILFLLYNSFELVRLRSIDQMIQDVETTYEENISSAVSKSPSKVWFEYEVEGRTEELVKLQLDMVITKQQWDDVIDAEFELPSRNKRNAVKEPNRLWPRKIPYVFNTSYGFEDKYKLLMAMKHWEEHTCLEFVEANITMDFDYIEFVPVDCCCESFVGRIQGKQEISLAKQCMYKEVIVHEIGHALGLWHEHMRHDRDDYVTIHYENIEETNHPQFDKLLKHSYKGYNKPYDYESVMHYGKLYFANRTTNLITIEPKDPAFLDKIGEAPSLSFYDIQIVNEMYKCSDGCLPIPCPKNGFFGKNCECYCRGENSYEIVLCEAMNKCGRPDIDLQQYEVYTSNWNNSISRWDAIIRYPDGTRFNIQHRNQSCGHSFSTINCTDGVWEGEPPMCEMACTVEDYRSEYFVSDGEKMIKPGTKILSGALIWVSCSNRKGDDDMSEEVYCDDGQWSRHINDIVCIKEHPLCTMVNHATLNGSFEEGVEVRCLPGYEMDPKREPKNSFRCSWDAVWEPYTPQCSPARCMLPVVPNPIGDFRNTFNEEISRGSKVNHGSDVTLSCPKGHVPDDMTFSCNFGEFSVGAVPECRYVTCPKPTVLKADYRPKKRSYEYGDSVRVGSCSSNLVLKGSRTLTCTKDGTWSDKAVCDQFCPDGKVVFETVYDKQLKSHVPSRRHGLSTFSACEKKCRFYDRYLCLSFVFGYQNGRARCFIYGVDAGKRPDLLQKKSFWTVGIRKCQT